MNLAEAIDINARARPDQVALVQGDRRISYCDLAEQVRTSADGLAGLGIRSGDLIGVCLPDTIDHLVANYALARLGAVILPMDHRWAEPEKNLVASHFDAVAIMVEPGATAIGNRRMVTMPSLHLSAHKPVPIAVGGEQALLLSLSSGTTSRPRGPRISHLQMLRRFWTHWINLGLNGTDRYVSATPLYFGGGRTFAMSVLFAGGTVVLFPPPFHSPDFLTELERVAATSTFLVPTQLRKMLELDDATVAPMRRLRLLLASGAPLDPAERAAITERLCANFVEYYASTEGGGVSISTAACRRVQPDTVGRPVFGVEVQVVGPDHRPLPLGMIGALRYRGPGVATGYFRDEAASVAAFRDGWFYPGDLAEIDAAGYISLRGRAKDMIIRGGVNIYPDEIETVLRDHPNVAEAAVVGRSSQRMGEEVAAFVVLSDPAATVDLQAWCAGRLAPYKVPRDFLLVSDLPRNSAGKVLKAELAGRLSPL